MTEKITSNCPLKPDGKLDKSDMIRIDTGYSSDGRSLESFWIKKPTCSYTKFLLGLVLEDAVNAKGITRRVVVYDSDGQIQNTYEGEK